jgi:hypothetical protein
MRRLILAVIFLTTLVSDFALSQVPVGAEFQVNTYSSGDQFAPQIASDAAGNFVVAWSGYQDGSFLDAFARR